MARGTRAKQNNMMTHKSENVSSVPFSQAPRLRVDLDKVLVDASHAFTERVTRTATVSKREAHRILDNEDGLNADRVARAHDVIEKYASAPA